MHKLMSAPVRVAIIADGEDELRLHKRISCAARALGIELAIETRRGDSGTPRILIDGRLLLEGLPRTEDIEQRLADWLAVTKET